MKVHAYVLAADPTWLRASVLAYYPYVDRIVVSYDSGARGWTGAPIQVDECISVVRMLDNVGKVVLAPGAFGPTLGSTDDLLAADTRQRRAALEVAAEGADWVLQIDTDEVLPNWQPLLEALRLAEEHDLPAVEWPMRVLYRRLHDGRFLEVAVQRGMTHFEYPGPIAVRPDVQLVECRRPAGPFLRPLVWGDRFSLQVRRPPEIDERRVEMVSAEDAIWHNSWARSPVAVRAKIASWSHNQGTKSWRYYYGTWLPSGLLWRAAREFHPIHRPLWPRLQPAPPPPFDVYQPDIGR